MATKIKARPKGDVTEILALIQHPMETGLRKDKKTKKVIPAHFIQKVSFEVGESLKIEAAKSSFEKCARCWNFWESVGTNSEYPDLCDRCIEVIKV